MNNKILLGIGRTMIPVPGMIWRGMISRNGQKMRAGLDFMTVDHHRIRNFVVRELAGYGQPMPVAYIAEQLRLKVEKTILILDDLENHLTFLYRNPAGEVYWAYPVTVDRTPHRVELSTGEEAFAA